MRIDRLFEMLDAYDGPVPIDKLTAALSETEITLDDVRDCVRFRDDHYARNVMHLGPGYVAIVLCWRPGQRSPVHDHRGSACGVRVVTGIATETRFKQGANGRLIPAATSTYPEGSVCGSFDRDIHVIFNEQPPGNDLVTLHVYTPPMDSFRVYSLETGEFKVCVDAETQEARRRREAAMA